MEKDEGEEEIGLKQENEENRREGAKGRGRRQEGGTRKWSLGGVKWIMKNILKRTWECR